MLPSEEAINEFQKIWESKNPGRQLQREQIVELATKVLRATELLYSNEAEDV